MKNKALVKKVGISMSLKLNWFTRGSRKFKEASVVFCERKPKIDALLECNGISV